MIKPEQILSKGSSNAASAVDSGLEKFASTIDKVRLNLIDHGETSDTPVPFVSGISDRLGSTSDRLRSTNGDEVVDYAKDQIEKHPALFTMVAAAAGAAAMQIVVTAIRKERQPAADALSASDPSVEAAAA